MGFLSDIIGGIFGNETADKQADAMVNAQKSANQTIMDMFNKSNQITAPNTIAGWGALSAQGNLLGLPGLVSQPAIDRALQAMGMTGNATNPSLPGNLPNYRSSLRGGMDGELAADYYQPGLPPVTVNLGGGAMQPGGDSQPMVQAGSSTGSATDGAYNAFLDSGFNRAMTDFTANDLNQLKAAYGAGGKALSGSAIGAMGDRLSRNRYNAFSDYYSALSGISGTGANLSAQQASQANQVGSQIAQNQQNIGNIRASSYGVQGQNSANMLNMGVNAFAQYFGGK